MHELAWWTILAIGAGVFMAWLEQGGAPCIYCPPVAVAVAFLLRMGWGVWPIVLAVEMLTEWLLSGRPPSHAFGIALGVTAECLLGLWILQRSGFRRALRSGPGIALWMAMVSLLPSAVGATLRVAVDGLTDPGFVLGSEVWALWWLSDAAVLATLLPFAFTRLGWTERLPSAGRSAIVEEAALLVFATAAGLSHVIAGTEWGGLVMPRLLLGSIPVLWAASRLGFGAAGRVIALLAITTFVGIRIHPDDLANGAGFVPRMLVLQGNLVLVALVGVALANLFEADRRHRGRQVQLAGELEQQVARTREAERSGRTGSWECELDGSGMLWSDELFVLCRMPADQTRPSLESLQRHMVPSSRELLAGALREFQAGAPRFVATVQFQWEDGTRSWHATRWERVDVGGRPRLIVTHADITDLVERRQTAEQLATVVSSSAEAIVTVDPQLRIREWNASAERMFGWSGAQARGRSFLELVPEDERDEQRVRLERVFRDGFTDLRTVGLSAPGRRPTRTRTRVSPVLDPSGAIAEGAILCGDLTRETELEHQLQQAQKMEVMGRLTGSIAHDFNNMLTAIQGFSELLRARVTTDPVAAAEADQILLAARRATALTQRLLDFSRRRPRVESDLEVDASLHHLVPLLRRLLGDGLELDFRPAAGAAHVRMDETQFEQILLNLVVNARDAMPFGGRLTVETARLGPDDRRAAADPGVPAASCVRLTVRDTGIGMDAMTREHIFEPFFTTKDEGRGTGLGLSTVLSIVQAVHGAIRVSSAAGEGTSFAIFLPEVMAGVAPVVAAHEPAMVASGSGRVLVVEDEPLVLEFLVACLEPVGYVVERATSAEQALERLGPDAMRFDVVITDVVLPHMSGLEFGRQLKRRRPELPILFLSGHGESLRDLDPPGPLLSKPFPRERLLTVLEELLANVPVERSTR
ncbi:MAG: ATP-binding protein [bacterium]